MSDSIERHLALVLRASELSRRVTDRDDDLGRAATPILRLARDATRSRRASFFLVAGLGLDATDEPTLLRVARVGPSNVPARAGFLPSASRPLIGALWAESPTADGPLGDDDPFVAEHASLEPDRAPMVAWAPVVVRGEARGVLQVARDERYGEPELVQLADAAAALVHAIDLAGQGAFVRALLELLPDVDDAAGLGRRIEEAVARALSSPDDRRAAGLAVTIAELGRNDPAALELAATVLSATQRAFAGRRGGGDA